MSSSSCSCCGRKLPNAKILWCARCKTQEYCSKECQVKDWGKHKKKCKTPEEAAVEKEKAEQLLREMRLSAARGSVIPLMALLIPEPDALRFTDEATEQRITALKKLVGKGPERQGWSACFGKGAPEKANDLLFQKLGGLFKDGNYAEICRIDDVFVAAAVECYSHKYDGHFGAKLLCVAFEIWHILGESHRKRMQDPARAVLFHMRARDAALMYSTACATPGGIKRSKTIIVKSILNIGMILLQQGDLVSDTRLYTDQHVIPLMVELHKAAKELEPAEAADVLVKISYLSAGACINVKEFPAAAKYLSEMQKELLTLSQIDEEKALNGEVCFYFKTAQLLYLQGEDNDSALEFLDKALADSLKRKLPELHVLAGLLQVEILIAVVYDPKKQLHDAYGTAVEKLLEIKKYMQEHKEQLGLQYALLLRKFDELHVEVLLRQARCMHHMLQNPETKKPETPEDEAEVQELVMRETAYHTAALDILLNMKFEPQPNVPFFLKSNLWLACFLVRTARFRKSVAERENITQDSAIDWKPFLLQAESFLLQVSASSKYVNNQSSYATYFLALLYDFWGKPMVHKDDDDARSLMLQYLNETFTNTWYEKEAKNPTCFGCGKVMQSSQRCAGCRTVNYCSVTCQKYGNLPFWKGGRWWMPRHKALCPMIGAFSKWHKKLHEIQNSEAGERLDMAAFSQSLSSKRRQQELPQDPDVKACLEKLHTLIKEFFESTK